VVVPKITTTTVSRGDSLWRISRLAYGLGPRYAVIYKANREQIRNPDLIYPGQIFVLPTR
jgi:nucleoid-associated protein YgaU